MTQAMRFCAVLSGALALAGLAGCATTSTPTAATNGMGVVVMHGKGSSPTKHVSRLASTLQGKGYAVANLEMPWSGKRDYDVDVAAADKEVNAALDGLRARGAKTLFVAGHSQGGLFALRYGKSAARRGGNECGSGCKTGGAE